MPHLLVDITAHGFGHAAMTLPVLDALHRERPDIRITLRTGLARDWLAQRLDAPFDHIVDTTEFGMMMHDSLRVRPEASLAAYRELHSSWPALIDRQRDAVACLHPDLVLTNISYLTIAGAKAAGVRAIGYSSLNWADVLWAYCAELPGAAEIRAQIASAYRGAELFVAPEPAMPMPSVGPVRTIGPVARRGRSRAGEIRARLGLTDATRLVLVSMGGIPTPIDFDCWPDIPGWHVVAGGNEHPRRAGVSPWSALGMRFIDVLASSDALIAKPGYGLFVEAVCNGVPMLHIPRDGWPETEAEKQWLSRHGTGGEISEDMLRRGQVAASLADLTARPARPPLAASGIPEMVAILADRLS